MPVPHVPVSWGEVIDKITILEIKLDQIKDPAARANVEAEERALHKICEAELPDLAVLPSLRTKLKGINQVLWDIEDQIREKERRGEFDADFITLARTIYQTNDKRAAVKREINRVLGSELTEEKSYAPY